MLSVAFRKLCVIRLPRDLTVLWNRPSEGLHCIRAKGYIVSGAVYVKQPGVEIP